MADKIKQIKLPGSDQIYEISAKYDINNREIVDTYVTKEDFDTVITGAGEEGVIDTLKDVIDLLGNEGEVVETLTGDIRALKKDIQNLKDKDLQTEIAIQGLSYTKAEQEDLNQVEDALAELSDKVVISENGKGLSSNDFTDEEKAKLAGIAVGANNYSLPAATASARGGITIGDNISISGDKISISKANITNALGYTPAEDVLIDTTLTVPGAAADAKVVGDVINDLDKIIAVDEMADGNVVLDTFIAGEEGEGGYVRVDASLTVEGMPADAKAAGDAIAERMMADAIIPISQGGTGATTAEEGLLNLGGFPNCKPVRTPDTDLNDYKTEGWYFFTTSYTPINIPGGGNGWLCVLSNNDQAFVKQIFYRAGTPGANDYMAWTRTYTSAAGWSTWAQIYTSKNDAFMGPDSTSQRSLQSAPTASSGAGLWVYGLDHANSGQFRLQTYNANSSTYYQLRGNPNGVMSWNGTLYINNTIDASSTVDNAAALIIGNRSGQHIVIDTNEIIPKENGTTGGVLWLGDSKSSAQIGGNLIMRSGYTYGTSLPAAGTVGRIFFKKV